MWQRFKMWLINMMDGRYGPDDLTKGMLTLYIVLFVLNLFIGMPFLNFLGLILVVLTVFRMFSKNTEKRRAENEKYLEFKKEASAFFKRQKNRLRDIKTHRYRKCPHCKAILRLPLKKGEMGVNCPRCKEHFTVKIIL